MSSAKRSITKHDPATGDLIGEFEMATPEEVEAAVARARAAARTWSETPLEVRLDIVGRLNAVIAEQGEAWARELSRDTGKPFVEALMTEICSVPMFIDFYRRQAPAVLARKKVATPILFEPRTSYVEHYPVGVVGVISPWNFPFRLAVVPVLSALIAGNTVVLKPSEVTPLTARIIADAFSRIGLPPGVFELLLGDGETGAALTRSPVDKLFFTGSVATGRKVMAEAARRPIPVELELGGKDAMIVCADADLARAAKAAVWGGLLNAGQMCISVERILVVDAVHDTFVAAVENEVARVRVGEPSEGADMGPITFARQLDTIERHVREAVAAGARIVTGGSRLDRRGRFYAPTLVTGVTPDMSIYREETFGPVLPVTRVRDEDEAIRLANDHEYGLTASVWTRDTRRGLALASRIEAGQVMVNDLVTSVGNPAIPFGGVKSSGIGRYHGAEGLLTFTHTRAVMVSRGLLASEPFWFPYREKEQAMRILFKGLVGSSLPRTLAGLAELTRAALSPRARQGHDKDSRP